MLDQLPFLLRLADDDSPTVRAKVQRRLRELNQQLAGALMNEIERQQLSLSSDQKRALRQALRPNRHQSPLEMLPPAPPLALESEQPEQPSDTTRAARKSAQTEIAMRRAWRHWLHSHHQARLSEMQRLEEAFDLLARWQLGSEYTVRLTNLLNEWAAEYMEREHAPDALDLCHFLFHEKGLSGTAADDYYHPLNSNLAYVMESGSGLPISLCCIFLLLGERLDLDVSGCNFPHHFLARIREDGHDLLIDCFGGGRVLPREEVLSLEKVAPEAVATPATAFEIISRVLNNLTNAYHFAGDAGKTRFVISLLHDLRQANGGSTE